MCVFDGRQPVCHDAFVMLLMYNKKGVPFGTPL